MKAPEGREAFLRLAERADVVIESFRPGVVDRLGVGWEAASARNPRARVLLHQRLRADRPALAVGGPRPQLPGRRRLPRTAVGRAAGGQPPVPGATVADSAGGGMHAVMAILAALVRRSTTGEGAYLDVSIADGVLGAHGARRRRVPRHRRGARAPARPAHRPLRVLRHVPDARRQVGHGRRHRAPVLGQPVRAARPRAVGATPARRRGAGPDPRRSTRGVPDPGPRRVDDAVRAQPTRASRRC